MANSTIHIVCDDCGIDADDSPDVACRRRVNHRRYHCPVCGRNSSHPDDVREGYCGNCHDWTFNKGK